MLLTMPYPDPLPRPIAWFAPWTWKRRTKIAAGLLFAAAAYPLSIGPAYGLMMDGWLHPALFEIYQPVIWLSLKHDSAAILLGEYMNWFNPLEEP